VTLGTEEGLTKDQIYQFGASWSSESICRRFIEKANKRKLERTDELEKNREPKKTKRDVFSNSDPIPIQNSITIDSEKLLVVKKSENACKDKNLIIFNIHNQ
jgi:hypothetical protein